MHVMTRLLWICRWHVSCNPTRLDSRGSLYGNGV